MIWKYRIGSYLSPGCRGVRNAQLAQSIFAPGSVQRRVPQPPLIGPTRRRRQEWALCPPPLPSSSSSRKRAFSSSPRSFQAEQARPQDARQHGSRKRSSPSSYVVVVGGGIILAAVTTSLLWWPSSGAAAGEDGDVINKSTFRAFTITSKEQVSPTAFILTVRSSNRNGGGGGGGGGDGNGSAAGSRIRRAWAHGLWSVEIKQPQLQIARHYTPLPPPICTSSSATPAEKLTGSTDDDDELRFLIRRMDGGEMSSYLSRLRVGDAVWLRGPHLGFDVARRLGDGVRGGAGARSVVFLAGGTGIAPALQVAHRLLEGGGGDSGSDSSVHGGIDGKGENDNISAAVDKPVVSILWANRRGVDALGRPAAEAAARVRAGWWGSFGRFWKQGGVTSSSGRSSGNESDQTAITEDGASSLSKQIREMQRRYPDNFRVRYFVDEEKLFISGEDIITAAAAAASSRNQMTVSAPKQLAPPPTEACPWHSAAALETLPNDDDASRSGGRDGGGDNSANSTCSCSTARPGARAGGVNLLFVSGPDGFIEAYAGPKKWQAGGEMQGPVRGLVGRLKDGRGELDSWLVLKL